MAASPGSPGPGSFSDSRSRGGAAAARAALRGTPTRFPDEAAAGRRRAAPRGPAWGGAGLTTERRRRVLDGDATRGALPADSVGRGSAAFACEDSPSSRRLRAARCRTSLVGSRRPWCVAGRGWIVVLVYCVVGRGSCHSVWSAHARCATHAMAWRPSARWRCSTLAKNAVPVGSIAC